MRLEIKKHFLTGFVILLPLALTIALVIFVINFFTDPFLGLIEHFLTKAPWYSDCQWVIRAVAKLLLLALLFLFTVFLGYFAHHLVFKSLLTFNDYLMNRIPVIKSVYKAIQQMMKAIFSTTERSFKQVVMVPFPSRGSYAIGLVSGPAASVCENAAGEQLVSVFIATTPNPTSGFLIMCKKEEVIYLDMKVEDAIKYIITCGVITTDQGPDPGLRQSKASK